MKILASMIFVMLLLSGCTTANKNIVNDQKNKKVTYKFLCITNSDTPDIYKVTADFDLSMIILESIRAEIEDNNSSLGRNSCQLKNKKTAS